MNYWESEISLSDLVKKGIVSLGRGRIISSIDLQKNPGIFPVYSSSSQKGGLFGLYNEYDFNEELLTWSVDGGGYFFYRPKHKFSVTNVSGILKVNEPIYDYKFLYYSLVYQHSKEVFDYVDKAHPSVIKKRYSLPTISLNEQKKIASILSKVDEAIENTEKLIQKYENVKIGLMQDLLTKGIDENGNIRSEETHQFKDSPLGRIPMEWEIKNLNDITHLVRSGVTPRGGSEVYGNDGVVFLRSQNIYPNKFKLDDVAYISISINNRMLGSELSKFDVLLNITGASIGRSTFVPEIFPKANVNQHVCLIRIKEPSLYKSYFISSFLNSFMGQNQIIQYNSGGNREGLNYKQIREFVFPWFSNNIEFQNFYKILSKIDKKINIELENFNKLNNQKQGLMQDLLSGKVRVND